jgi:hypothetical protein
LYTTPASTEAVISSLVICNQSSSSITIRVGLDTTEGTPGQDEFLIYDAAVAGNDTVALSLGIALDAGKYVRVSSSADTCSFSAFVSEIS